MANEDLVKIGDLRRELFMRYDCLWNGLVRDITAELEQPDEWCSRSAVLKILHERCANMMQAFDLANQLRN